MKSPKSPKGKKKAISLLKKLGKKIVHANIHGEPLPTTQYTPKEPRLPVFGPMREFPLTPAAPRPFSLAASAPPDVPIAIPPAQRQKGTRKYRKPKKLHKCLGIRFYRGPKQGLYVMRLGRRIYV